MKISRLLALAVVVLFTAGVLSVGCDNSYKKKNAEKVAKTEAKIAEEQKAEAEKAAAAAAAVQPPAVVEPNVCHGPIGLVGDKKELTIEGKKYSVQGHLIKLETPDEDDEYSVGVITDIKDAIPTTMENLKKFYAEFADAKVDAIVVTGDSSENYDALKAVFTFLGEQQLPPFIIMGNSEKKADFVKALTEVQATYPNLFNMNIQRRFDADDLDLISLAGYYDINYIHNPPGCLYGKKELDDVALLAKECDSPAAIISHGPPRGEGKDAIDHAVEAGNVGDPEMAKTIVAANIPFGIFGNIHEAGGKAVGVDFKTVIAPETMSDKLYLNPGPASSDPWNMNDGKISNGMAGIFKVKGGKAMYKIISVK